MIETEEVLPKILNHTFLILYYKKSFITSNICKLLNPVQVVISLRMIMSFLLPPEICHVVFKAAIDMSAPAKENILIA